MTKKWKRSKNRILPLMVAFLCLFSLYTTEVNAMSAVSEFTISSSKTFSPVLGNLDGTHTTKQSYESSFGTNVRLETGKRYLLYGYVHNSLSVDFKYDDDRNNYVYSDTYLKYGGSVYPLVDNYVIAIVDGAYSNSITYGVDVSYNINPYVMGDGYIYQNECQAVWGASGTVVVYSLEEDFAVQFEQIMVLLESIEDAEIQGNLKLTIIQGYIDEIEGLLESGNVELVKANEWLKMCRDNLYEINRDLDVSNDWLMKIRDNLYSLNGKIDKLLNQTETDASKLEEFNSNSSSQSSELGQLNQENQVEKIDIDSASSTVDTNIDMNAIGNSGVVLSALTGENKILVMMLGVSAIALVAYVFFGKR